MTTQSEFLDLLQDRIDLKTVPFTDRDARLLVFGEDSRLNVRLAEFGISSRMPDALIPSLSFKNDSGQALAMETTTLPYHVACKTELGTFSLGFADADTLLIALPPGRAGIELHVRAQDAQADRRGGILQGKDSHPYSVVYTTNAHVVKNEMTRVDSVICRVRLQFEAAQNQALLINFTRTPGFNRYVPDPRVIFEANARRWHAWFAGVPAVPEPYRRQYYFAWWIMGINLIYPYFHPKREGMVPSKQGYIGIWNWDAYFHALALRHVDLALAKDQFRIMLDFQLPNGMIPDVVHDGGVIAHTTDHVETDISKPPLTAWAIWKLYEMDEDREFLSEMYDPLVRSQQWWFDACDVDGNGLCEYQHPYSSGLDDSPLFDYGLPVESPDLTAYLILQYDHLTQIAAIIGEDHDAEVWREKADSLTQHLIDMRWDADAGLFWAWHGDQRINTITPFNLFPLITGHMPKPIADKLAATLTDADRFWTPHPVPTVAANDPAFEPETMWRGPVWININYLLIDGLRRAGYRSIANDLHRRTVATVMARDSIFEYYHTKTGHESPTAAPQFGWSTALFIDLVLQLDSLD